MNGDLEYRVSKIENWRETLIEEHAELKVRVAKIEETLETIAKKIEDLNDRIDKLVISGLATILMILINLIVTLVLRK
jgi:predicted  nucleic acid-binding Zn-ribbon protein